MTGLPSGPPNQGPLDQQPPPEEQFALLWEQNACAKVEDFVRGAGPLPTLSLAAVLHVDQCRRWQAGERVAAEYYLQRFPQLLADADAVVDVIFHEYTLREQSGESPRSDEYRDRFPNYAEQLERQIAFHRLVQESELSSAGSLATLSTVDLPAGDESGIANGAERPLGLVRRGSVSSRHEVQSLLRVRLRLFATISCVAFLLYIPVLWTLFGVSWGTALYCVVLLEAAIIAALLWSRLSFSLRALRWIEACLFFGLLVYFGYQQVQFFQIGFFSSLALDSWIGPAIAARSMSWPWAVTIISYGILIPNTARRGIVAVVAMAASFLAITASLALATASVPQTALWAYVLCSATDMAFAAAIAIFGAYRIATLQQAASLSRKLGPYRLVRRLGAGGMGEVYLAEHALLRRPCALKLIRPEKKGDARFLSRFEREVQAMATLTHPNTVRVYDYGLATDGTFYYAMEYLPGLSLQDLVSQHGPLPPGRVVYLLRQVCDALREAHAVRLVHRDIKPANIIASETGGMFDVAKLVDFGLVHNHTLGKVDNSLTIVGAIAGTPAFMSPEQAAGANEVDERSDIYSLGAVAYFLLTGRPPFVHATPVQTMAAHLSEHVESPRRQQPETPLDLEQVVLRCLEKEPDRRFANVTAVGFALECCGCRNDWSSAQAAEWWRSAAVASIALTG